MLTRAYGAIVVGVLSAAPMILACFSNSAAPRPVVSRQFAERSDDWTADMPLVGREVECQNGKAMIFDCQNVGLLAYLPGSAIQGDTLTDLWGWTDPATGREFVIATHDAGTSFVEITDPVHPRYLGDRKSVV